MRSLNRSLCLAALVTLTATVTACGSEYELSEPEARAIFEDAFDNLQAQYRPVGADPCDSLSEFAGQDPSLLRPGLLWGASGYGTLGIFSKFGGVDLVWDAYHGQMTVAKYTGKGIGTPSLSAGGTAYVGAAFGFQNSVADWYGWFGAIDAELSLPFMKDYLSVVLSTYGAAWDANEDGSISLSEITAPEQGVYGFSVGIRAGIPAIPNPLPVGGGVSDGLWTPHKPAIRSFYDQYKTSRIFGFKKLAVRLIDIDTGEPCPETWPEDDIDRSCIIDFGDPEVTRARQAIDTSYAICRISGCFEPTTFAIAATALALGTYESSGLNLAAECSGQ